MSSTSSNPPQLGFASKLGISYAVAKSLVAALVRLPVSPFKGSKGAPTLFRDVMYAVFRSQLASLSIEQSQYLNKSTSEVYLDCAKEKGFEPVSIDLNNGAKAHWIGDKSATVTMCYFHGGGYAQPASPGHLNFLYDLVSAISKSGVSISICVLAYGLAPQAQYPTQLIQASSLINYLLKTESRSPDSLIIAGDSAGGNLTLGIISHVLHPHASVPKIELNGTPFRAAFTISPWVSFDTSHPSFSRNAESDMFDRVPLELWSKAFLGPRNMRQGILMGDAYSEPLLAQTNWWAGADKVVDEILIWGGGGELFEDGILAFSEKFKEGWVSGGGASSKISVIMEPRNCHVQPVVDSIFGYKEKGPGATAVQNFVKSKL